MICPPVFLLDYSTPAMGRQEKSFPPTAPDLLNDEKYTSAKLIFVPSVVSIIKYDDLIYASRAATSDAPDLLNSEKRT